MSTAGPSAWLLLRAALFTLLVPGTLIGWLPWWLVRDSLREDWGLWSAAGWPLIVVGALGYLHCLWSFVQRGGGTPSSLDPPLRFVATGLYRRVRNPMYLVLLLCLAGQVLVYEARVLLLALLGFWAATHAFVVLHEEPHLRRRFGESYEQYLRSVPRWWPRGAGTGAGTGTGTGTES